jgi:Uma2 family endonuclease
VRTPGLHLSDNSTTLLDARQVPQPDCILFINSEFGGRCQMNAQGYVLGPPELAVEISASTESYDLGAKFRAYERNGIREYLVWRVLDATIDWYELQGASYVPLAPDADGTMRSRVFPGLWLDVAALLRGDLLTVVETLGRGLESAEHAGFVRELRKSEGK